jgi:ribosomal protein S18 acetylase RimI-like enzyme
MSFEVRTVHASEEDALVTIGEATGIFGAGEADALLRSTLRSLADGTLPCESHVARAEGAIGRPRGWSYLAREESADGVWELMWIGVTRDAEGAGVGRALLLDAESTARAQGARILLISTSCLDGTARARAFYARNGYAKVGEIPDYYAPGDGKVIFHKAL